MRCAGVGMGHEPIQSPIDPSAFAGYRFPPEAIMLAVGWCLRYGLSYRDVEELLVERGIEVDPGRNAQVRAASRAKCWTDKVLQRPTIPSEPKAKTSSISSRVDRAEPTAPPHAYSKSPTLFKQQLVVAARTSSRAQQSPQMAPITARYTRQTPSYQGKHRFRMCRRGDLHPNSTGRERVDRAAGGGVREVPMRMTMPSKSLVS